MTDYVKLAEAPRWSNSYPTCTACRVDLTTDSDDWLCPVCGTSWPMDATDGDEGTLYEEWSGEKLPEDQPVLDEDAAANAGHAYEREGRKRLYASFGWCEHAATESKCSHRNCPGGRVP